MRLLQIVSAVCARWASMPAFGRDYAARSWTGLAWARGGGVSVARSSRAWVCLRRRSEVRNELVVASSTRAEMKRREVWVCMVLTCHCRSCAKLLPGFLVSMLVGLHELCWQSGTIGRSALTGVPERPLAGP